MNREERVRTIGQWLQEAAPQSDLASSRMPGPERGWQGSDLQAEMSLERIEESLARAYLAANLCSRSIPLKEFMDNFEKRILASCLRLTQGNQKNVAAVLCLKPNSLHEKLCRFGIHPRRRSVGASLRPAGAKEIA